MTAAPTSGLDRWEELRSEVAARAVHEGRVESCLPGVWFFRSDRPSPMTCGTTPGWYTGVIVQGRKRVRVAGHDLTYAPPSYLVVTGEADFEASVLEASAKRPYLSMGLVMPPELVAETLVDLVEADTDGETEEAQPAYLEPLTPALLDAMLRLVRALDHPAERRILGSLALREIVFRLLRSGMAARLRAAVRRQGDGRRIQEAMAYIREHAMRRLTVDDLARRFGMSPSHFAHRFRDVARVSPMRYVKHVRLMEARMLLLREGRRSSEAAERVGYASASQFTRDFKSHFGMAPGAYVQRFRGTEGA